MPYPAAIDPNKVGEYPAIVYTGGGYFFDEVLEYRVWCLPDNTVEYSYDIDACHSFVTYQEALAFAENTENSAQPLALVRQFEWVDQPSRGIYIHNKGERLTEWRPEWLDRGTRKPNDIAQFLQKNAVSK
ncbi:GCN5 family acetyltransferase [Psychrobacter frigidicola]|uniref:GCN5 family acetyltransferase n=1 Tax=Psychrobacter frigidicola TaxID=45611 RepID=A0A5C6ZYT9_9GAMM|nr:GCN5 family acetyltransferase [Psychrobacter frigidicola]TXD96243.1 GCN5 family acetyltransferase [Psychrobacter frigidicola]